MERRWLIIAAVFGFMGVAMGAFGAHGLRGYLLETKPDEAERMLEIFMTGSHYAQIHGAALLGVGILSLHYPSKWLARSGWAFTFGTVVFSTSLWALVLSGQKWLGAITPIGGVFLLIGWFLLGLASYSEINSKSPSSS